MDSVPLEMDDIFGDFEDAEDFQPARLPDLEDELEPMRNMGDENENRDDENDGGLGTDNAELFEKLKSMKGASKHTVKKPIPKLDATRLTGERGIPVLPKIFRNVPLRGRNHEAEDLKIIMHHLEHWGHRLFPKMPFAEVLERAERLGAKKEVQTCVKKIRLDMAVLASDQAEDGGDQVQRRGDAESEVEEEDSVQRTGHTSAVEEINEDEIEELLREQERPVEAFENRSTSWTSPAPSSQQKEDGGSSTISEDMKARIERNKKLAMERRAARAKNISQGEQQDKVVDTPTKLYPPADDSVSGIGDTPGEGERSHATCSEPEAEDNAILADCQQVNAEKEDSLQQESVKDSLELE